MFQDALNKVKADGTLSAAESEAAIAELLNGGVVEADIMAFLSALHTRGETEDELLGAVRAMRARMTVFAGAEDAIDCCGTGGDNQGTFNISTAVAFVLAGAGVRVAKHGNRAVSSRSGSSDLLTALGVKIDAMPAIMNKALNDANICFLFAPLYHPAMRHVTAARVKLRHRTLFNLLGPLANPARVKRQVAGVYDKKWLEPFARILTELGSTHVLAVNGDDGLDEISVSTTSHVVESKGGQYRSFTLSPEEAGLKSSPLTGLKGGDAATNARKLHALLREEKGPYRDSVLINAAAGLMVAGKAKNIQDGVKMAAEAIERGRAEAALNILVRITNGR